MCCESIFRIHCVFVVTTTLQRCGQETERERQVNVWQQCAATVYGCALVISVQIFGHTRRMSNVCRMPSSSLSSSFSLSLQNASWQWCSECVHVCVCVWVFNTTQAKAMNIRLGSRPTTNSALSRCDSQHSPQIFKTEGQNWWTHIDVLCIYPYLWYIPIYIPIYTVYIPMSCVYRFYSQ